jgi:molybdenum cofactor cytidylyltransferase
MGHPKALLPWGKGTVLAHHQSVWNLAGAQQVAVVVDPTNNAVLDELRRLSWVDVIANDRPEDGMMSSLRIASAWPHWQKDLQSVAVILVDQPQFPLTAARRLMDLAAVHVDEICQPQSEGRRGHPVVLPYSVFAGLASTPAATMRDYLREIHIPRRVLELESSWWLDDMNVPGAYERILELSVESKALG